MEKKNSEVESIAPDYGAVSESTFLEIPVTHMDDQQLKYTEAEVDCIIEKEEAEERRKVHLQYAAELAMLKEELAEVKHKNEVTREDEDIHLVFELNFLSDTCLSESELSDYKNLVSDFDEFEVGVVQCNEKFHQTMHPTNEGAHNSVQSLNSSFEDLQHRYKQLKEDCAKKVEALKEAMKLKSKLEKLNQQLEARFQSFIKDTTNDINRANTEYSSLQKKLVSDLAVEKASAKKVELEVASLDKNLQQMEQEKKQLSQICEELMKELSQR